MDNTREDVEALQETESDIGDQGQESSSDEDFEKNVNNNSSVPVVIAVRDAPEDKGSLASPRSRVSKRSDKLDDVGDSKGKDRKNEKKESKESKSAEDEDGDYSILRSLCLGGCLVLAFFSLLGTVMFYFQQTGRGGGGVGGEGSGNTTRGGRAGACTAHSFLIRDGVCDEVTNNPVCFFDGGDCCRQDKDKKYCTQCTCKREDPYLQEKLSDHNVTKFRLFDPDFDKIDKSKLLFTQKTVMDVASEDVCSIVCLDDNYNSWIFVTNADGLKVCKCTYTADFCKYYFGRQAKSTTEVMGGDVIYVKFSSEAMRAMAGREHCEKMIAVTGLPTQESEVVDIKDVDQKCLPLHKPFGTLYEATGGLLRKTTPFLCGGLGTYWEYTTGCYVIDNDRAPVNLTIPRGNAASIVVGSNEEELFMAGGLESSTTVLNSTLYVRPDAEDYERPGPDMPVAIWGHCFVKINPVIAIAIGGARGNGESMEATHFFDIENSTWSLGPPIKTARETHTCEGVREQSADDLLVVVVIGGLSTKAETGSTFLRSVELLAVDEKLEAVTEVTAATSPEWYEGPELSYVPLANSAAAVSFDRTTLYLSGGFRAHPHNLSAILEMILKLTCPTSTGCLWEQMQQTLKGQRWGHVAMMVPDHLTFCYEE